MSLARFPKPDDEQEHKPAGGKSVTTEIVNLLNKPIMRSRNREDAGESDDSENRGITLQPWMISLLAALFISLLGWATMWGTVMTRLDAQEAMIERLMRITDADRERERLRSPANYTSPPLNTFGRP